MCTICMSDMLFFVVVVVVKETRFRFACKSCIVDDAAEVSVFEITFLDSQFSPLSLHRKFVVVF